MAIKFAMNHPKGTPAALDKSSSEPSADRETPTVDLDQVETEPGTDLFEPARKAAARKRK